MTDDAAGAVRRTPRPYPSTEDRQTPETAPQESAGTTNEASPVSGDQLDVSSRVSSQAGCWPLDRAVDRVVAEFAALPECLACGGSGKDDHATVFEAPLAVHFAGPPVKAEGRRRQLCMWCGHVLRDVPSTPDAPPPWPDGALVRVEDGLGEVVPYEPGAELPPGCCALPDDGEPVCICTVESTPCPDCRDDDQDEREPVDVDPGDAIDGGNTDEDGDDGA